MLGHRLSFETHAENVREKTSKCCSKPTETYTNPHKLVMP